MSRRKSIFSRLGAGAEGAAAVEMAIVLNLLLLLIMGMMDFGHAWYMRQLVINASREGARYAVVWRGTPPTRDAPVPDVSTWVLQNPPTGSYGLAALLPTDAQPTVTVSPGDLTTAQTGDPVTVTVTAQKTWWVINNFVPGLPQPKTLMAQTIMRAE